MKRSFLICSAVAWFGVIVPGSTSAQDQLAVQLVVPSQTIVNPTAVKRHPIVAGALLCVEKRGQIRVFKDGALQPTPFLDIRPLVSTDVIEQGLLGLAFDPEFTRNRAFYLYYTEVGTYNARIVRYEALRTNLLVADPDSALPILTIPYTTGYHNGGTLKFGDDGYLTIGTGDGDIFDSPAQHLDDLRGKLLRIDPRTDDFPDDPDRNYAIPPTNPHVGEEGVRPEIWSIGLRNPWKYSFDMRTRNGLGGIYIGDVGQGRREEVDHEPWLTGHRNYGWRVYEGSLTTGVQTVPAYEPLTFPIHEYPHTDGICITGGHVYRGMGLGPEFYGRYFFYDFGVERVWSLFPIVDPLTGEATMTDLREHTSEWPNGGGTLDAIGSINLDHDNELLIVGYYTGKTWRIVHRTGGFRTVTGNLTFQGRTGPLPRVVEVEFRNKGETTPLYSWTIGVEADGAFTLPSFAGEYDLAFRAGAFLRKVVAFDATAGNVSDLAITLRPGDVNRDNSVNIADFLLLRAAFGSAEGSANWNPLADLDGNGTVNVADFIRLRGSFGTSGDA